MVSLILCANHLDIDDRCWEFAPLSTDNLVGYAIQNVDEVVRTTAAAASQARRYPKPIYLGNGGTVSVQIFVQNYELFGHLHRFIKSNMGQQFNNKAICFITTRHSLRNSNWRRTA